MNIAWIDVETTGLDPHRDLLLEIAVVVTDDRLNELAPGPWEALIDPGPGWQEAMSPIVAEMHRESGLTADLTAAIADGATFDLAEADACLRMHLSEHVDDTGTIALAGSGASHFETKWLPEHLPRTADLLPYWALDSGTLDRWLRMLVLDPHDSAVVEEKRHRALADVRSHLHHARRMTDALRSVREPIVRAMAAPRHGDRCYDGGELGTLERCPQCSGDGLLHRPDHEPAMTEPDG